MTTLSTLQIGLRDLLLARSVAHGDFVLASGRRSSVYVDARKTTMAGAGLTLIGALGLERLDARGWAPRAVGGLTLGADPVAYAIAAAAHARGRGPDAFTVRKAAKTHGTGRRIEGCFESGMPVVVIEDVLTSGGSARDAVAALREAGATILGVLALVDRQEGGRAALETDGIAVDACITAEDLGL